MGMEGWFLHAHALTSTQLRLRWTFCTSLGFPVQLSPLSHSVLGTPGALASCRPAPHPQGRTMTGLYLALPPRAAPQKCPSRTTRRPSQGPPHFPSKAPAVCPAWPQISKRVFHLISLGRRVNPVGYFTVTGSVRPSFFYSCLLFP